MILSTNSITSSLCVCVLSCLGLSQGLRHPGIDYKVLLGAR